MIDFLLKVAVGYLVIAATLFGCYGVYFIFQYENLLIVLCVVLCFLVFTSMAYLLGSDIVTHYQKKRGSHLQKEK